MGEVHLWAGEEGRKKEKLGPWKGRRSEILQTAALKNVFSIKSPDIWYLQNQTIPNHEHFQRDL